MTGRNKDRRSVPGGPWDLHRHGHYLAVARTCSALLRYDLRVLDLETGKGVDWLRGASTRSEAQGRFSPDGRSITLIQNWATTPGVD